MRSSSITDLDGKKTNIDAPTAKIPKCELGPGLLEMTPKAQSRQEFIKSSKLKTREQMFAKYISGKGLIWASA